MIMDAHRTTTMWRRRKPITTRTTAKPLYNTATWTLIILLFNITSAALTLAGALGNTTSEAAAAVAQHNNGTNKATTTIVTKSHLNATNKVSAKAESTETQLIVVPTTTPASGDGFTPMSTVSAVTALSESTQSASTLSTTTSMHRSGSLDVRYEVEHKADLINDPYVQIVFCIIYATVFVLGIFGNALVCYVVLRNRAMHSVTNYFITNLAISDILLCVLAVPFTPLYTFMGRWIFGAAMCHMVSYAQGCSIYLSTFTLTAIAVDRVFVIVFPFKPRMQIRTCYYTLAFIWCFSLIATTPYALYMRVVVAHVKKKYVNEGVNYIADGTTNLLEHLNTTAAPYGVYMLTDMITTVASMTGVELNLNVTGIPEYDDDATIYCEENWPSESFRRGFGILTTTGQFIMPLGAITICYIWVSVRLNMRERCRPGAKSAARDAADRERKKRTNFMLIAMVGVFACSWLPMNIVNMVDDFYDKSNDWSFYTFIFFITHALAMSSTCYNPFLYAWLNENFRKEFKHVLPCFNPSKHRQMNRYCYNRSDRNTCGGARRNDMSNGVGVSIGIDEGDDDENDNGVTQETSLARAKEKCTGESYELTCSNGGDALTSNNKCCNTVLVHGTHVVDIALNDKNQNLDCSIAMDEDCVSGDEHTVEMHFTETAFVSLDNGKDICLLEAGCNNKEVGEQIFN